MDIFSIQLYFLNVIAITLLCAIFEIIIEKDNGWGGALDKKRWYGKIVGTESRVMKFLAESAGVPYFFGYAIAMYFVFVPTILLGQYFFLDQSIFLFAAIYFSVLAIEDFTWFLLNPYFHSLQELLKGPNGSIWWHKKWIKISDIYLPQSYLAAVLLVIIFLILGKLA